MSAPPALLLLQSGNYAEAWRRFAAGEAETYRDQKRSVDFVASLAGRHAVTTAALCDEAHDEVLAPGLRSIGLARGGFDRDAARRLLDEVRPARIVCRRPDLGLLAEARARGIPTLPCFADLFATRGPKSVLRNLRLNRVLSAPVFPCVANHSLNASLSVARHLRIPKTRIVPWDWSPVPPAGPPKTAPAAPGALRLFYAGVLKEAKGVGDCIEALAILRDRGVRATLTLAGPGDAAPWRALADRLGLGAAVAFPGRIGNAEVRAAMRAADAVLVPSRHAYPEGLPNTIYEGLASGSALLISDHPAFRGRLVPGRDCLEFRASDPASLAAEAARLVTDNSLYSALSARAPAALDSLYIGMEWADLVTAFLDDPANATGWVARNSLAALGR